MIVTLTPRAPFAKAVPRSDTLFGAVAWALRTLYGLDVLQQFLAAFDEAEATGSAPPLVMSSLLPRFSDARGEAILFLPRPLQPASGALPENAAAYAQAKRLRQCQWVSLSVFNEIAAGRLNDAACLDGLAADDGYRLHGGALVTAAEYERVRVLPVLPVQGEMARNAINRLATATGGDGGQLYYEPVAAARAWEKAGAQNGFAVLLRLAETTAAEWRPRLHAAWRWLGERGLGGDSSIGRGHCDVSIADETPAIGAEATAARLMTLSLWHPNAADRVHLAAHGQITYARLVRRKGFLESAFVSGTARYWKPTVVMLAEGATFPRDAARAAYGSLWRDTSVRGLDFTPRLNGLAYTVALEGAEG